MHLNAIVHDQNQIIYSVKKEILLPLGTAANFTSDGHLAALAIEYDVSLFSTDTDRYTVG
jgi:hypothetical protein